MANRSANVIARVEPDVKTKAESILFGLGISVSTVINALYRQIIYTNGIPFSLTMPRGVQSLDMMSESEFDETLSVSLEQAKNGENIPLDEALDDIEKDIKK